MNRAIQRVSVVLIAASTAGCFGWIPGQKAYWDHQVKTMCEKDGGLKVFEVAEVSARDYELFRDGVGYAIRDERYSGGAPIVRRFQTTYIRDEYPIVRRYEQSAVRLSDGKVLATHVSYGRTGGDFPDFISHPSSFLCPSGPALRIDEVVKVKE